MGTPEFAVPALKELLKEKLNIIHVYTQPPKKSNRGLKIEKTPVHLEAEKNNLKVHHPSSLKNETELDFFKKINPDLVIVVAYGQIIPENFLNLSKLDGIIEYLPEELYIKVLAGTPIETIEDLLEKHNQQLEDVVKARDKKLHSRSLCAFGGWYESTLVDGHWGRPYPSDEVWFYSPCFK